jgi:putative ABC transport system ATP-binding protein
VAVVGPSGSGKTTLLNIIGCLDRADAGKVVIDGVEVGGFSAKEATAFRAAHLGFIFQDFNLIESFSVYENIELPLSLLKPGGNQQEQIERVLDAIGMRDQMHKFPGELSGGQKQRVAVARALVLEPKIVLADEPTANLDSRSAHKVIELMQRMQEEFGTTFVFSTHDTKIVDSARRVITLQDGKIQSDEEHA